MRKHTWIYEQYDWSLDSTAKTIFEQLELSLIPISKNIETLTERELSTSQIGDIFSAAEQISKTHGQKTAFGSMVRLPDTSLQRINRVLVDFKNKLSTSSAIKDADDKIMKIEKSIKGKITNNKLRSGILSNISRLWVTVSNNPAWGTAVIGLLTAISGMKLGQAAMPAVSAILTGAYEILKGENPTQAAKKSVAAGTLSAASGPLASALSSSSALEETVQLTYPMMEGLWSDLTLKYGAGKLNKAWEEAGQPTDSKEVAQLLASLGMTGDEIKEAMIAADIPDTVADSAISSLHIASDDEDIEIPFTSGDPTLDAKAKEILKNKGTEEFINFWEKTLLDLESQLRHASTANVSNREEPSAAQEEPPIVAEPISTPSASPPAISTRTWKTSKDDIINAIDSKNINKASELLAGLSDITTAQKQVIQSFIASSNLSNKEKNELSNALDAATLQTNQMFEDISNTLKKNKLTWRDLGFNTVIKDRAINCVILF